MIGKVIGQLRGPRNTRKNAARMPMVDDIPSDINHWYCSVVVRLLRAVSRNYLRGLGMEVG